jgi:replicative DNA helicase
MKTDHQILYSQEAERAVLGSMMARPDVVMDLAEERLMPADFFVPAHVELFKTFGAMHDAGIPIDITTVHQYLVDGKMAEVVGSPGILAELMNGFASHLNVGSYIDTVREKSQLRLLQEGLTETAQDIADGVAAATVLDSAEERVFAIRERSMGAEEVRAIKTDVVDVAEMIIGWSEGGRAITGLSSGLPKLDMLTTGWQEADYIVVGGRPGVGKSTVGQAFVKAIVSMRYDDVLDRLVKPGYPAALFTVEMTKAQLLLRGLSTQSDVSMQPMRKGEMNESERAAVRRAAQEMSDWPLYIDESTNLTINRLRSKLRRLKRLFGIRAAVIDYLQLLMGSKETENRQAEIAEISRGIKAIAKELKIPIIVLAQLNRKSQEGKNSEPNITHLRESGAIEQDADVVLLLHEEEQDPNAPPSPTTPLKMILAKQRNGPTDSIDLLFDRARNRIYEKPPESHAGHSATPTGPLRSSPPPQPQRDFATHDDVDRIPE